MSSSDPVRSFVVINPWASAHEAEENVTRRPDHDSRVPAPHYQIAGPGVRDALEAFYSSVEIVGIRIGIGEARSFVNRVNQVRTVVARISAHFGIERGRDHCQPIVWSQCPVSFWAMIPARGLPDVCSPG